MTRKIPLKTGLEDLYADNSIGQYIKGRTLAALDKLAEKATNYLESNSEIFRNYLAIADALERYIISGSDEHPDYRIRTAPKSEFLKRKSFAFNIGNRIYVPRQSDIRGVIGDNAYREVAKRTGMIGKTLDKAILDAVIAHEIADVKTKQAYGIEYMDNSDMKHAMSNYLSIETLKEFNPRAYLAAEAMQELRNDELGENTRTFERRLKEAA